MQRQPASQQGRGRTNAFGVYIGQCIASCSFWNSYRVIDSNKQHWTISDWGNAISRRHQTYSRHTRMQKKKLISKLRPISHSDKKIMPGRYPELICFYYTTVHLTFFEHSLFNCFSSVRSGYASHKCPGISMNTRQNDNVNFLLSTL